MKSVSVIAVLSCFAFTLNQGTTFPLMQGETLDGKTVSLPSVCRGKKAVIGLAYSEKAQEALASWHEPMFDKFVAKVGMFDGDYDVRLFFVPMFIGLKQAAYQTTLKKLRSENRKDLYPYVVFYKGELEPYDSELGMKDKTLPYFFVLDEQGKILYNCTGGYSDKKMEDIEAALH